MFRFADPRPKSGLPVCLFLTVAVSVLSRAPGAWAEDEPPVEELPPITVEAPRVREPVESLGPRAPLVMDSWLPASVLSGPRLERRTGPNLGALLDGEPGVAATQFSPGASRPLVRGLGGDRIRVLEGGIGTLDASSTSPDHAVAGEALTVRSVEVVRGPAALRFGSTAVGGAVNVRDGRIADPSVAEGVRCLGSFRASTVDDGSAGALEVEGRRGGWGWHGGGWARQSQDYDIPGFAKTAAQRAADGDDGPHGTVPSTWTHTLGGTVGLSRFFPRAWVGASYSALEHDYGVPSLEEEPIHIELRNRRFDGRGQWRPCGGCIESVDFALGVVDYEHTEFEEDEAGTVFRNDGWEGRLEATHCCVAGWTGAIGLDAGFSDFRAIGDEAFVPPSETWTGALYLIEERPLSTRTRLHAGARVQVDRVEGPETETFVPVSGSLGLVHRLGRDTSLSGSASYTQRAPTATELFADGPHVATQQFEIGDPDLGIEQALSFDLALRHDSCRFSGEATVFYNRYFDFIDLIPTGGVTDGLPEYEFRAVDADFVGGELRASWHALVGARRALDLELLADVVRGENRSLSEPLPRIPPVRVGVGLIGRFGRVRADASLLHAFEQDQVADFERTTDAYTLLEAGVRVDLPAPLRGVRVEVRGTNLLDEEARVHPSPLKEFVPLPGRSFHFAFGLDL
jgi:iron complex outermembrane receptor protein